MSKLLWRERMKCTSTKFNFFPSCILQVCNYIWFVKSSPLQLKLHHLQGLRSPRVYPYSYHYYLTRISFSKLNSLSGPKVDKSLQSAISISRYFLTEFLSFFLVFDFELLFLLRRETESKHVLCHYHYWFIKHCLSDSEVESRGLEFVRWFILLSSGPSS